MGEESSAKCKVLPMVCLLLAALIFHAIARHFVVPLPTSNALSLLEYALRSFFLSSAMFAIFAGIPICVGGITWLVSGKKQNHCLSGYIINGLLVGFLISLIMVFFSWYGSYRAGQYNNLDHKSQNVNGLTIEQVHT
jgi:uncharacterized membrane protein